MDTTTSIEERNATYRAAARYNESVVPTWQRVAGLTPDEYERRYLAAWEKLYQQNPHYLYPDDRGKDFPAQRSEDVSAISFAATAQKVRQARADTLHSLTTRAEASLSGATDNEARSALANLLKDAAYFVGGHTLPDSENPDETEAQRQQRVLAQRPLFETLQSPRFTPKLPGFSGIPDYRVDEPKDVGEALGLLQYFFNLREQFLAAELPPRTAAAKVEDAPKTEAKNPDTLFNMLCDGMSPDALKEALGKDGLRLYDIDKETQTDTAKPEQWAYVYWALRNQGYLPKMPNKKAAEIIKAINAKTSKTAIGNHKQGEDEVSPKDYERIFKKIEAAGLKSKPAITH